MTPELTPLEKEIMSNIKVRSESMLSIKTLTLRYAFFEHDKELLLQYSMVMVYSIWEGFIQTAFQTYVRELNKLGLTVDTVVVKREDLDRAIKLVEKLMDLVFERIKQGVIDKTYLK